MMFTLGLFCLVVGLVLSFYSAKNSAKLAKIENEIGLWAGHINGDVRTLVARVRAYL